MRVFREGLSLPGNRGRTEGCAGGLSPLSGKAKSACIAGNTNPERFDRVKRANKRSPFTTDYAIRLQQVHLECCDALRIIQSRDTPEPFWYLDPP
ncbi:MAG: hypothetical protein LBC51_07385 [Treponema sp.]|nr:hypothetical protein [Treponema sp.]